MSICFRLYQINRQRLATDYKLLERKNEQLKLLELDTIFLKPQFQNTYLLNKIIKTVIIRIYY